MCVAAIIGCFIHYVAILVIADGMNLVVENYSEIVEDTVLLNRMLNSNRFSTFSFSSSESRFRKSFRSVFVFRNSKTAYEFTLPIQWVHFRRNYNFIGFDFGSISNRHSRWQFSMLVASIHYGGFSASEQTISEYISSNINFLLTVRIYAIFKLSFSKYLRQ